MRLDKYLKNARIIKRRSVANTACSSGKVSINDKVAKPGSEVKVGDMLALRFGEKLYRYQVLDVSDNVSKDAAQSVYKVVE